MYHEDVLKFRVGQCGSCGLRVRFWPKDGCKITCVHCDCEHEVEVDTALNLSSGEKSEMVMLVPLDRSGKRIENEKGRNEN